MLRSASSLLLLVSLLNGCAFGDGRAWGEVQPSLTVRFAPPAERLTAEGWLKTSSSFAIEIHELRVTVDGLTLEMSAGDTNTAVFDPANPPEGFSLCHNGHCHADSGGLVPYEEVVAQTGTAQAGGGTVLKIPTDGSEVAVGPESDIPLEPCPNDCALPRGRVTRAASEIMAIYLVATVHDLLPADQARLPAEGLAVDETLTLGTSLEAVVDLSFGKGKEVGAEIAAGLHLGASLFDGLDWSDESIEREGIVSENVAEGSALDISINPY